MFLMRYIFTIIVSYELLVKQQMSVTQKVKTTALRQMDERLLNVNTKEHITIQ